LAQTEQHALKRTRRQQAALETRQKLIEAAILCMAKYGPAGVTLDRVTDTAGVSRGLVRHHFGGKRQLLISAFDRLADEQRAKFNGGDPTTEIDAVATLRTTVATSLRDAVGSRSRAHAWFGFWQAALRDPALGEVNERLYADERSRYVELFRAAAQQLGLVIDERQAGRGLQALADGMWNELVVDSRDFKIEEALELCNRFIDLTLKEGGAAREGSSDG
jgi:AcrR family transcriptional regulator